jgi:hypothetical protein
MNSEITAAKQERIHDSLNDFNEAW